MKTSPKHEGIFLFARRSTLRHSLVVEKKDKKRFSLSLQTCAAIYKREEDEEKEKEEKDGKRQTHLTRYHHISLSLSLFPSFLSPFELHESSQVPLLALCPLRSTVKWGKQPAWGDNNRRNSKVQESNSGRECARHRENLTSFTMILECDTHHSAAVMKHWSQWSWSGNPLLQAISSDPDLSASICLKCNQKKQ